MSTPYSNGTSHPPVTDTNVEIQQITEDVSIATPAGDGVKVIIIKEPKKKSGYGTTYFMLGALFVAWCIIGTVVKNKMLEDMNPAYQDFKEVRNHPWISKLALSEKQIDVCVAFTKRYEACENNTFFTASWDALMLNRATKDVNMAFGKDTSTRVEVKTKPITDPKGLEVTHVNFWYQGYDTGIKKGSVLYFYDGKPLNSLADLDRAKADVPDGKKQVEIIWNYKGKRKFGVVNGRVRIGLDLKER